MSALTIRVLAEHRDDMLRQLLGAYALKADALHHASRDYIVNERALDPVLAHRAELAALDSLIDQLGWRLNDPPQPASLTGHTHLLAEAAFGAFHTALDDLPDDLPRGAAGMETIRHDLRRLMSLFAMVEHVYQAATRPIA